MAFTPFGSTVSLPKVATAWFRSAACRAASTVEA